MRLYIGGPTATEDDLIALFSKAGTVKDAYIMADTVTGNSRGFGILTMEDDAEAESAIKRFDRRVNEARPRARWTRRPDLRRLP